MEDLLLRRRLLMLWEDAKYLDIDPVLIWVYPDWAVDNDVYSNTFWEVD